VALSFKVRATFTVMKALGAVGVLPTAERVVR
jgi:hypothetical protein